MKKFKNRQEAGQCLADLLSAVPGREEMLIFALPRGGVPVAYEIAKKLKLPLDVFVVRKLGMPGHQELAMGALAAGGVTVFNEDILQNYQVNQEEMDVVIAREKKELARRIQAYRDNLPFPQLEDKTIILVDDGIATGATMRAAIKALKKLNAAHIVVAVPVAQKDLCLDLAKEVDQLICPLQPENLYAVGNWFEDFSQTEDQEVRELLLSAKQFIKDED